MGDHAFIGSATNIVAPVTVTAAGSTITEDVPSEDLAIGTSECYAKVTLHEGLTLKVAYKERFPP